MEDGRVEKKLKLASPADNLKLKPVAQFEVSIARAKILVTAEELAIDKDLARLRARESKESVPEPKAGPALGRIDAKSQTRCDAKIAGLDSPGREQEVASSSANVTGLQSPRSPRHSHSQRPSAPDKVEGLGRISLRKTDDQGNKSQTDHSHNG